MSPRGIALLGAGLVSIAAIRAGEAQSPAPSTLDALLQEVRGLRADVNQVAGTSIRTQLLVGRLQLQEQRINGVAKQLTDAQTQRSAIESAVNQMQEHVKQLENRQRNPSLPPEERRQIDKEVEGTSSGLNQMRKRLQQLTAQETAFEGQLSTEQSRWLEFNDRLDQIEREIGKR